MSDVFVGGRSADTATVLLAAAEDLDLGPEVVRSQSKGYLVPKEVASKAGVEFDSDEESDGLPAKTAKVAVWRAYAVDQGMDPDEAEAATKADLIEQYGTEE